MEDTPLYDIFEEDTTDADGGLAGKNEKDETPVMATRLYREVPTPKVNNNYVNALVMLSIGGTYDRGKVISGKIYSYGNSVGRRNDNSILDTHEYRVEFDDG